MKFLRFFISFIFIFVFLGTGLIAPIIFIYQSGKNFIEEVQLNTKNRALEITSTLDTMSGESLYYDNLISLSNVMAKIKNYTNIRNDPYKIEEIFLLDNANRLLAHNDITKVAKDYQPKYDKKIYKLGEILFSGNPIQIETIGFASIQLPEEIKKLDSFLFFISIEKIIINYINKYLPDLLAEKFHVYSSVYPPDENIPKGSLHIVIKNYGIVPLFSYWLKQVFYISLISLGIFIILLIFFINLLIKIYHYNDLSKHNEEIFEDMIEIPDSSKATKLPEDELSLDYFEPPISKEDNNQTDIEQDKNDENNKQEDLSKNRKVVFINSLKKHSKLTKEDRKNLQKIVGEYENVIDALPLE